MTHNLSGYFMMLLGIVAGFAVFVVGRDEDDNSEPLALIVVLGGAIVLFIIGFLMVILR